MYRKKLLLRTNW